MCRKSVEIMFLLCNTSCAGQVLGHTFYIFGGQPRPLDGTSQNDDNFIGIIINSSTLYNLVTYYVVPDIKSVT